MHTIRSSSRLLGGGCVPAPWGVCSQRGVCSQWGCLLLGGYAPRGVSQHALRQTPHEQNDRQV